jgi:hypothetical protein
MPGSPVLIGPFIGGINTYSEPTQIADNECQELINFDIDLDGSLVSRPSLTTMPSPPGLGSNVLGTYTTTAGSVYFVIIDTAKNLRVFDVTSGAHLYTISTNIDTQCVVQYQNKLWVIATPNSANPGGSWDPVGGFTAIAAMARGISATIYKERLYVASGSQSTTPSRLNFSAAANLSSWTPGTDFLDVNNGDGLNIVKIYAFGGRIVVFKDRSTYTFSYDSQPTKGQTELVAANVGITNVNSFAEFEGVMYVLFSNTLYSITNWNWDPLNVKVPFIIFNAVARTTWGNSSLSIVGNRLICRYYDTFYVFGLRTRAFTTWRFANGADYAPSHFLPYPFLDPSTNTFFWVAGCYDNGKNVWYKFIDTVNKSTGAETFNCSLVTKIFDYKVPYTWKRMFWWGADILAKTTVSYLVHPVAYNIPIKWSQISNGVMKWSQLQTWAKPLDVSLDVTDSTTTANPSGTRMFQRLNKGLRFRQISFKLSATVDGTTATGPLKVFSLTAVTSSKALVSKKIN